MLSKPEDSKFEGTELSRRRRISFSPIMLPMAVKTTDVDLLNVDSGSLTNVVNKLFGRNLICSMYFRKNYQLVVRKN
jgi:hypothetical protein